ncbi:hypothetical protein [Dyadobacter sp. LHD-138]|uniref:hypothetical protein n=1 Tax=Dyadobacter sp. LHD-138 TaxID=3071413 RepID=UPI0027DED3DC|nr:hypothetical protein [Dyadobacter sp. LHD-138]MDQ6479378.1 hypothetical protein [Dyadobacter sp. LHD-138]
MSGFSGHSGQTLTESLGYAPVKNLTNPAFIGCVYAEDNQDLLLKLDRPDSEKGNAINHQANIEENELVPVNKYSQLSVDLTTALYTQIPAYFSRQFTGCLFIDKHHSCLLFYRTLYLLFEVIMT